MADSSPQHSHGVTETFRPARDPWITKALNIAWNAVRDQYRWSADQAPTEQNIVRLADRQWVEILKDAETPFQLSGCRGDWGWHCGACGMEWDGNVPRPQARRELERHMRTHIIVEALPE